MAFEKDWKGIAEALRHDLEVQTEAARRDLEVQIARTTELEQELASIKFGDAISLRERIAMEVNRVQGWGGNHAEHIYNWIMSGQKEQEAAGKNKKKGKRGRPKKVIALELAAPTRSKKRRKYTKKSKFWAKKKK